MSILHHLPAEARQPASALRGRGVSAILGPTNTGKTHHAIERMLGHESGMIGLPLRLLAREVYQRLIERVGVGAVALITGEEKIKPKSPRYWVSTVEAMPRDIDASFVAIDEVQLIADADRGHVFTDALLHRRGRGETLLLGAATARPLIERLLPGVLVQMRPRLSTLTFAGEAKITRLPPRSAIIAFSAEEVYAIAELVRRHRGGAAVVMGSLSPRTRNAQVAMFQAGEVDHIVATDAIGMGLNLEITHVAFAGERKFDGQRFRRLFPAEFAQIAGRAGRARQDGTFGTTARCPPFDDELVEALENHVFDPLVAAQWRNSALEFSSLVALEESLSRGSNTADLQRASRAEDEISLEIASSRPLVRDLAAGHDGVHRLWDLCQLPDYRKLSPQIHADLIVSLYEQIMRKGSIDAAWFGREIAACDRIDGDIDTLSWRLAQVRTWSYCANRNDWINNAAHWQNVTRALEDRLSDALHEKLLQRFVDRRTSVLMRRLKENAMLEAEVNATGDVIVEGQHIGRLEGFRFTPDPNAEGPEAKALRNTAVKALGTEIETRATRLSTAGDEHLTLSLDGVIRYLGEPVAALTVGAKLTEPRFVLLADEQLAGLHRELAETRLNAWLKAHVTKLLGPLQALEAAESLTGIARGIAFQVYEGLGILDRAGIAQDVRSLDQSARGDLRKLGLRFGAYHLFLPALMKPGPRSLAAQLHMLFHGGEGAGLRDVSYLAFSGRTSIPVDPAIDTGLYRVAGFKVAGPRAIRIDILERLADLIRPAIAYRPGITVGVPPAGTADGEGFVVTGAMTSLVGSAGVEFGEVLKALGYRAESRPGPAISVVLKLPAATKPAEVSAPTEIADTPLPDEPAPETIEAVVAQAVVEDITAELSPARDMPLIDPEIAGASEETGKLAELGPTLMGAAEDTVIEDVPVEPLATDVPAGALAMIEIWRVARPERSRNEHPRRHQRQRASSNGGEAVAGQPPDEGHRHRRADQRRDASGEARQNQRGSDQPGRNQPGRDQPGRDQARKDRPHYEHPNPGHQNRERPNQDRPNQERPDRRERFGGNPRYEGKGGHNNAYRNFTERKPPADKPVDPDSPFAALMALKAKMEGKN